MRLLGTAVTSISLRSRAREQEGANVAIRFERAATKARGDFALAECRCVKYSELSLPQEKLFRMLSGLSTSDSTECDVEAQLPT